MKTETESSSSDSCPIVIRVIVVFLFLEKLVIYGIRSGLVLLLNNKLNMSREEAVIVFHLFLFLYYLSGFWEAFLRYGMTSYR